MIFPQQDAPFPSARLADEENDSGVGQMILGQLIDQECALLHQAQKLRTESHDLGQMQDDEAMEESRHMDAQAGQVEQVAKRLGELANTIRTNPQKKIPLATVNAAIRAAGHVLAISDATLEEGEDVKEAVSTHHQSERQHAATASANHKEEKASKLTAQAKLTGKKCIEKKEKQPAVGKEKQSPREKSESVWQKTKTAAKSVHTHYIAPAMVAVKHTLHTLHDDYVEPAWEWVVSAPTKMVHAVTHSAPVTFVVSAGLRVMHGLGSAAHRVASVFSGEKEGALVPKEEELNVMGIATRTLTSRAIVQARAVGIPASLAYSAVPVVLSNLSPLVAVADFLEGVRDLFH